MNENSRPRPPDWELSVCVPTHRRPQMLERALRSVLSGNERLAPRIEVVVSDNGPEEGEPVFQRVATGWPGQIRYLAHRPGLGAIGNFNRCISEATGRYLLILHDDDYLLPGGLELILESLRGQDDCVVLFGVDVVDADGHVRRRQAFSRRTVLEPSVAMRRLLTESSFVRMPALVVRRDAYDVVGVYDPAVGNPTDFDLLVRLFARFGVACEPATVAAYTVHDEAATESMFNEGVVQTLMTIFQRAAATNVLPRAIVRRTQADWFHQWILGGTYRRLRAHDVAGARATMALFSLPSVRALGWSGRWRPIRLGFAIMVRLPDRVSSLLVDAARRFESAIWASW